MCLTCLSEVNDAGWDSLHQPFNVPVHSWSYRGPPALCGTQSGQRPGQKTDQPHTLQPYWEEGVKDVTANLTYVGKERSFKCLVFCMSVCQVKDT